SESSTATTGTAQNFNTLIKTTKVLQILIILRLEYPKKLKELLHPHIWYCQDLDTRRQSKG
ncbi:MAG: hypothetical protein VX032_01145, partial [SAR324 cluster bacterium]|nr:hypothetical protein [SAR324 cluster bacterium]